MAEPGPPPSEGVRSYDAGIAKSDNTVAEKRRRQIVILMRIGFPAPSLLWRTPVDGSETLGSDQPTQYDQDADDDYYYDSDWEWLSSNWKRGSRPCRSTGAHKKPKTSPRRILTRPSLEKKQRKTKENIQINAEARKENNELRLKRRHIQRLGLDLYYRRTDEHYCSKTKTPGKMTAPCGYVPHKQRQRGRKTSGDHPAALLYELKHEDISDEFSRLLVDLQHRDLTPEDYETLLRLDEKVAPKTVSESALSSFETLTLESTSNLVGELCSICMEVYSVSQSIKTLPCSHTFHSSCIDTWLSSASLNCPLDGIAVQS